MKMWLLVAGIFLANTTMASGFLEVSQFSHGGTVPKNGVRIPFLTITATARDADVHVQEVHVRRNGLSEAGDFTHLILITDDSRRSVNGNIDNEDIARLRFRTPYKVPQNETRELTVYGNLRMDFPNGRTVFFTLENLVSDAENVVPVSLESHPVPQPIKSQFVRKKPWFRLECENRMCRRVPR